MTAAAPARHITPPSERVSLRTKIAFGLGTSAESIVAAVISLSALYFYNNILKMPGTLTGLALMLSLVLDGIADPLVGSISDRTKGKLGRRHIYMYVAPLFSCTALALIFNPPDFLKELGADGKLVHQMELFAWLACFIGSALRSLYRHHAGGEKADTGGVVMWRMRHARVTACPLHCPCSARR